MISQTEDKMSLGQHKSGKKDNGVKRFNFFSFLRRQLTQEAGFSLAEVMVAAGMLGVLSLGVTQLMQNSNKTEKRLGQQVNMVQLESDVMDALRNQTACTRTFYGIDLQTNPLTGQGPNSVPPVAAWCPACVGVPGDTAASGAAEPPDSPGWRALPSESLGGNVSRIYGASRESTENNPNQWRTVLAEYDAGFGTGVYGNGSNTISIRDITYRGFFDDGQQFVPQQFNQAANYTANGNGSVDPIAGSNPGHSVGWVVVRVRYVRGRWAQLSTLPDDATRAAQSAKTTTGQWQLVKFYPIRVRVEDGTTNIVRCLGGEEDWLSTICESMFDGYLDPADGRCKQTRFRRDSNSTGAQHVDDWTLVAENDVQAKFPGGSGGNVLIEDSLLIGGDLADNPTALPLQLGDANPGGPGNRGNLVVRNNTVTYNTLVVGDSTGVEPLGAPGAAFGPLVMGPGNANIGNDLHVFGNAHVRGNGLIDEWLNVGGVTNAAGTAGDATFARDIRAERNGRVDNVFTVGMNVPGGSGPGDAFIARDQKVFRSQAVGSGANLPAANGQSVIEVRETIGLGTVDAASALRVEGGRGHFSNGTRNVYINNGGGAQALSIYSGGTIGVQWQENGQGIYYQGGAVRIRVNQNVGTYNAIKIYNQPLNDFGFSMTGGETRWELPTKAWVKRFVYGGLYENNAARINDIINNMADYVNHRPWEQVRSTMCTQTRLLTAGQYSSCTYAAGVCTCQNSNCSSRAANINGSTNICSNMRLLGFLRVTGAGSYIYSQGYVQAGSYVSAGTNVSAGNNVNAGNAVVAGGIIRGAAIYTNSVANPGTGHIRGVNLYATANVFVDQKVRAANRVSATRICEYGGHSNNAYCYTKFGRLRCNSNGFMIGIAYGHPVCARSGGGASSGVRF